MALRSIFLLLLAFFAASALFGVSSAAFGGRKSLYAESPDSDDTDVEVSPAPAASAADLGFEPQNTKDPKMIELAKFALDDINKASNKNLTFESVLEAIKYVKDVKVPTYGFVILVNDGTGPEAYTADVEVDPNDDKKVIDFHLDD